MPLSERILGMRAVVELAPTVYLIADYLDASQSHVRAFTSPT